jgi:uroporphyrin-III C-methyltransferase / precorrin-2 dehydrogenase / sirohydrochlorin ferrochelatase
MTLFPAFLKLQDRPVLVVGGGELAASKIPLLLHAGASVTVVAPQLNAQLMQQAYKGEFAWLPKLFAPDDLDDKFLVIAATSLPEVNASVFAEADRRQILCNAVDDINHCHFYYGSIVQRGDLQIAISTNGKSPALAQRLRKELEQQFDPEYAAWLDHLGIVREHLRARSLDPESTKQKLHALAASEAFDHFKQRNHGSLSNDPLKPICHSRPRSERPAVACLGASPLVSKRAPWVSSSEAPTLPGKVFLLGAGPGDPDLLTVKSARLLESANIVLHDSLVSAEILALIPATAQRIDVGKRAGHRLLTQSEINSLLVDAAHKHEIVVRLKGGDPLLFGRAAEEIEALRGANIQFEIVPGISSAFASAAAAQISLTDRRLASRVLFTTFSRTDDARAFNGVPIASDTTVVVYMPGPDYAEVSHWLSDSGVTPETPCLVVSKASQQEQAVHATTLSRIASLRALPAPALLIVGRVASHSAAIATAEDWLRQEATAPLDKISIS